MIFSFSALLQGFGLGASLIIAIGAQNAFVLRQGLKRIHVFTTASLSTLCDALLIALGVGGLGTIIAVIPTLAKIMTWAGVLFLLYYGFRSFRSAIKPGSMHVEKGDTQSIRVRDTVLSVLAFSLLNPHVYLDTVVLVGSVGAHYAPDIRVSFALGAMLASCTWFFSLAYGAAWLTPVFQRPMAWRILDACVGCIMWGIAISLIVAASRL